jgi:hypothetical protein
VHQGWDIEAGVRCRGERGHWSVNKETTCDLRIRTVGSCVPQIDKRAGLLPWSQCFRRVGGAYDGYLEPI